MYINRKPRNEGTAGKQEPKQVVLPECREPSGRFSVMFIATKHDYTAQNKQSETPLHYVL